MQQQCAFGTWKSSLSAAAVSAGSIRLRDTLWDGETLYWSESRPTEKGRLSLFRHKPGQAPEQILPAPWNVRSRVHEYGGLSYGCHQGTVFFVQDSDQQIYRFQPDSREAPQRITQLEGARFAEPVKVPGQEALVAVLEIHSGGHSPSNHLAWIDLTTGKVTPLPMQADFFASPVFSGDGKNLAWVQWNQPFMPWESTELHCASVGKGSLGAAKLIAGNAEQSISQPKWHGQTLYYVSDQTGFWNLYDHSLETGKSRNRTPSSKEFCRPWWNFGQSQYAPLSDGTVFCTFTEKGLWSAGLLKGDSVSPIALPFTEFDSVVASVDTVAFIGSHPGSLPSVATWNSKSGLKLVRELPFDALDKASISTPESLECQGEAGKVQFFFYPPKNSQFQDNQGRPPLTVLCHGGPTAATGTGLSAAVQYWTSRGFAVADVNYSGSTGFGRTYRERLNRQWGVLDVSDCAKVAEYLVEAGRVHPQQVFIRGGSAGGLTVLNALLHWDIFAAGASYFGVTDLKLLAQDTHKFEARYLDSLVGAWPADKQVYEDRSPIVHADRLKKPVVFFQGLDDKVVPPNQSESMYEKLKSQGVPTEYFGFAGEGHGFRQPETQRTALEAELSFYLKHGLKA